MREREKRISNIRTVRRVEKKKIFSMRLFLKNRDFIAGNLETEYNKNSEDLHRWNEKRSITVKNQAVMNIWVKKEQEDICNVLG